MWGNDKGGHTFAPSIFAWNPLPTYADPIKDPVGNFFMRKMPKCCFPTVKPWSQEPWGPWKAYSQYHVWPFVEEA